MQRRCFSSFVVSAAIVLMAGPVRARDATEVRVAVAANFTEPAKEIAALFETASGKTVVLSFGATGQFYNQISQGAPYDILLSADAATPAKAIVSGFGVPGTSFTYALGKLVLYSKSAGMAAGMADGEAALKKAAFDKIAIANPTLAPYGAAAIEAMRRLGVYESLKPKIVEGTSIAQAFQFVETGNAEVGFVALSQVIAADAQTRWLVPQTLYAPITQDAVLLRPGSDNDAAEAFMAFLKGPGARAAIAKYGYGLPE